MRKMECELCGCLKSEHTTKRCKVCCDVYYDNYREFQASGSAYPWHKFKLNNLRWLEQQYENTL